MAMILEFRPRHVSSAETHGAARDAQTSQRAHALDGGGWADEAAQPWRAQSGEIILFTGVRYSRDEDHSQFESLS